MLLWDQRTLGVGIVIMVEDEGQVILSQQWENFQIIAWKIKNWKTHHWNGQSTCFFFSCEIDATGVCSAGHGFEFMEGVAEDGRSETAYSN